MFNLKGPQGQTPGPLVVRGPQFEKRWPRAFYKNRWFIDPFLKKCCICAVM